MHYILHPKKVIKRVKLLIEKGIDINKKNRYGPKALHIASEKGHTDIVELLTEKGAEI